MDTQGTVEVIEGTTEIAWPEMFSSPLCTTDNEKVLVTTTIPSAFANSVFRTRLNNNVDQKIDEIMQVFKKNKVPMLWYVTPNSQPQNLEEHLRKSGLKLGYEFHGMAVDLQTALKEEQPKPPSLKIIRVIEEAQFSDWINIQFQVYGLPTDPLYQALLPLLKKGLQDNSWIFFLAFLNDKPVGASLGRYVDKELKQKVVGIFLVAVIQEARKQGIGGHITLAPLLEGKNQGFKMGALYATEMGYPIYLRLGFQDWFKFPCYSWSPSS